MPQDDPASHTCAEAYFPAPQVVHVLSKVAPGTLLAFPASHSKQTAEELALKVPLYLPATQEVHEPAPDEAYVPATQEVHPVAPVFTPLLEYLPAPHVAQLLDSLFPA